MVQFKAGSYKMDSGFVRSIERKSGLENQWKEIMVLVNIRGNYEQAEKAALLAKMDIDTAHGRAKNSEGTSTIDHELVKLGYDRVDPTE